MWLQIAKRNVIKQLHKNDVLFMDAMRLLIKQCQRFTRIALINMCWLRLKISCNLWFVISSCNFIMSLFITTYHLNRGHFEHFVPRQFDNVLYFCLSSHQVYSKLAKQLHHKAIHLHRKDAIKIEWVLGRIECEQLLIDDTLMLAVSVTAIVWSV